MRGLGNDKMVATTYRHSMTCILAPVIVMLAGWVGRSPTAFAQTMNQHPHYEMALDADAEICPKLLSLYNRLLAELLQKDRRFPLRFDGALTNFATTNASSFTQIGLTKPPLIKEIPPVEFYSVAISSAQQPRTLALLEFYRGTSPLTSIAVFKAGIPPRLGNGHDALFFPPVRRDDVDVLVSVDEISQAQHKPAHWDDVYLLTKWPGFSGLLSHYSPTPLSTPVPSIGGGVGVTIAPFQSNASPLLYFVYDQYLSIRSVKGLSKSSRESGLVIVQRLRSGSLDDVCYLVLAPSKLASTVESENVR